MGDKKLAAEKARVRSLQVTLKEARDLSRTYKAELVQEQRQNDLLRNRVAQLEAELRVAKADVVGAQRAVEALSSKTKSICKEGEAGE